MPQESKNYFSFINDIHFFLIETIMYMYMLLHPRSGFVQFMKSEMVYLICKIAK